MPCFSHFVSCNITFCLKSLFCTLTMKPLKYLNSQSSVNPENARWVEYINEYSFVLKHIWRTRLLMPSVILVVFCTQ